MYGDVYARLCRFSSSSHEGLAFHILLSFTVLTKLNVLNGKFYVCLHTTNSCFKKYATPMW